MVKRPQPLIPDIDASIHSITDVTVAHHRVPTLRNAYTRLGVPADYAPLNRPLPQGPDVQAAIHTVPDLAVADHRVSTRLDLNA